MDYTLAGFTFHFQLDENGQVVSVTTPDIALGPISVINSFVLTFSPVETVAGAEQWVHDFLHLLGLV